MVAIANPTIERFINVSSLMIVSSLSAVHLMYVRHADFLCSLRKRVV